MEKERKLIVAGNWKMNKTAAEGAELAGQIKLDLGDLTEVDVVVCPPFTALEAVSAAIEESTVRLGAQDMSANDYGAYTGEVCSGMLREFGVRYVILGHSERRQYQAESDVLINTKAKAALGAALKPIVCVGELLEQREANKTEAVVGSQLSGSLADLTAEQMLETVIAYEPVWAIGTGLTATPNQAQEVHAFIRGQIAAQFDDAIARRTRIQYGGSVKPGNARDLLGQPDVDGALVGGASLDAHNFVEIIKNTLN
ncbi:MAG: triose-phosphate isomerase [Verrucomicrobiales bacterium]|nr:triose-phosphate isomerase [Verrucomicrobiales bacterium]|tara:strand:- start:27180 stop:27947 length:768 start_codon:yes stop_codon:yes gene_type:complete